MMYVIYGIYFIQIRTCRSLYYDEGGKDCYLSELDRNSEGATDLYTAAGGKTYFERYDQGMPLSL